MKLYYKETQKNKGITMVALVITVIILLILVGVSIYVLTGPNGSIQKGLSAKELAEIDSEKEALTASIVQLLGYKKNNILENTEEDREKLQNNLEDYTGSRRITVSFASEEGYIFKVIFEDSKRVYYVDADGDITDKVIQRYTVNFYLENVNDSEFTIEKSELFKISDEVGKTITVGELEKNYSITGGTFSYATVNGERVEEFTEEKGKIVNLYYTRNSYKLELARANENISSVQGDGNYKYGQEVEISAILANTDGYSISFAMWKSDNVELLPNQISPTTTIKMPASNIKLTATASKVANTYTVTYNGNGATGGSTASSTHTYGIAKNLTTNGFTKTGYTFTGWNTLANGTGTSYTNDQSVINLTKIKDININLYAQWKDYTAPTVSAITVSDIQTTSVNVSLTAQDTGSGIVKVEWLYKTTDSSEGTFTIASTETWTATTSSITTNATIAGLTNNTSYTIQAVVYDESGMTTTKTATVKTIEEMTVEKLISQNAFSVGDYVEYSIGSGMGTNNGSYTIPATLSGHTSDQTFSVTSYTGTWQILYTGSEGYGAQIVSTQSVIGSFSWGTGTYGQSGLYIKGDTGYANLVQTLNTLSGYYINPNYASSARSLGSLPSDLQTSLGNTDKYSGSDSHVPTTIYADDTNYTMDETQLNKKSQLKQATGAVWLASRSITNQSTTDPYDYWVNLYGNTWASYYANYGGRIIYSYGTSYGAWSYAYLYPTPLVFLENTTYSQTPYSFGAGARPCIKLNSDLRLEKTTNSSGNTVWKIVE